MLVERKGRPKIISILVGTLATWVPYYDLDSFAYWDELFNLVNFLTKNVIHVLNMDA